MMARDARNGLHRPAAFGAPAEPVNATGQIAIDGAGAPTR
jgi:hypothetical protein